MTTTPAFTATSGHSDRVREVQQTEPLRDHRGLLVALDFHCVDGGHEVRVVPRGSTAFSTVRLRMHAPTITGVIQRTRFRP